MKNKFKSIADNESFKDLIFYLIILNAVLMGIEATPAIGSYYSNWLYYFFITSQVIFIAEIAIRLLAYLPNISLFFKKKWNVFDFIIVALSLVPTTGGFILIIRLFRALRILRIISTADSVRDELAKKQSFSLILYSHTIVFMVVNYILALLGYYLFADDEWNSLGIAFQKMLLLINPHTLSTILFSQENTRLDLAIYSIALYTAALTVITHLIFSLNKLRLRA